MLASVTKHGSYHSTHFVAVRASSVVKSGFFFSNHTTPSEIYTLSLHDALPIWFAHRSGWSWWSTRSPLQVRRCASRSEEHTSELHSRGHLVCRLLLEKKKIRPDY